MEFDLNLLILNLESLPNVIEKYISNIPKALLSGLDRKK